MSHSYCSYFIIFKMELDFHSDCCCLLLPSSDFLSMMISLTFPNNLLLESRMAAKYIVSSFVGTLAFVYAVDNLIADQKIFGGTTPKTVSDKDWWLETDKKFQAWPRTAGPPVVMNPISRQNFIVKSSLDQ